MTKAEATAQGLPTARPLAPRSPAPLAACANGQVINGVLIVATSDSHVYELEGCEAEYIAAPAPSAGGEVVINGVLTLSSASAVSIGPVGGGGQGVAMPSPAVLSEPASDAQSSTHDRRRINSARNKRRIHFRDAHECLFYPAWNNAAHRAELGSWGCSTTVRAESDRDLPSHKKYFHWQGTELVKNDWQGELPSAMHAILAAKRAKLLHRDVYDLPLPCVTTGSVFVEKQTWYWQVAMVQDLEGLPEFRTCVESDWAYGPTLLRDGHDNSSDDGATPWTVDNNAIRPSKRVMVPELSEVTTDSE